MDGKESFTPAVKDHDDLRLLMQADDFSRALRNPIEHGFRVLSDLLQAGLKGLGSLLPELGWTPPEGWDKDLGKS